MGKVSLPLMSALESDGDFSQCPSNLKCCTVGHVQAEKKKNREQRIRLIRFTILNQGCFCSVFTVLVLGSLTVSKAHGQMTADFKVLRSIPLSETKRVEK